PRDVPERDTDDSYLSSAAGLRVLVHSVHDSDLLTLRVYEGGEVAHRYYSDISCLGEAIEDENGEIHIRCAGRVYGLDEPRPQGAEGADARVLAPFGVGSVNLERLGSLLSGEGLDDEQKLFAEERHWAIVEALNLQPAALTSAYRHANVSDYAGAVVTEGPSEPLGQPSLGPQAILVLSTFVGGPADGQTKRVPMTCVSEGLVESGTPYRASLSELLSTHEGPALVFRPA
ncbi:hypothetical protein, partial [Streptacidiphilus monticola]